MGDIRLNRSWAQNEECENNPLNDRIKDEVNYIDGENTEINREDIPKAKCTDTAEITCKEEKPLLKVNDLRYEEFGQSRPDEERKTATLEKRLGTVSDLLRHHIETTEKIMKFNCELYEWVFDVDAALRERSVISSDVILPEHPRGPTHEGSPNPSLNNSEINENEVMVDDGTNQRNSNESNAEQSNINASNMLMSLLGMKSTHNVPILNSQEINDKQWQKADWEADSEGDWRLYNGRYQNLRNVYLPNNTNNRSRSLNFYGNNNVIPGKMGVYKAQQYRAGYRNSEQNFQYSYEPRRIYSQRKDNTHSAVNASKNKK